MTWEELKSRAYQRMLEDIEIGYMDRDIIDLIKKFFQLPYAYTKSSCSGRIVVVDSVFPWSREGTMVFKTHEPIKVEDLEGVIEKSTSTNLWVNSMGPIIHVVTKDLDSAFKVLRMARNAGFKHSGILTKNEEGWFVELTTGVRANVLVKVNSNIVIDRDKLPLIVKTLNDILVEGKKKLEMLEQEIEEELEALRGS